MDRLDANRMFLAVMETGSFTAAAARLGTSSGQASKLVSSLENALGVRLLNRTTRAIAPTEAGQAYFERMRTLLEEFDSLEAAIKDAAEEPSGRLRITAPLTFGAMALTQVLSDFARVYPRIALDVNFSDRIVNLVDEGFDVAIRIGRPDDSAMIARKLCDMRLLVVAAPDFLAESGTPTTPEALGATACIIDTNFREPNRWPFRNTRGESFSAPVQGRLRFSNAEACLNAAEAGLGLACVPSFVAAEALRAGRVVRVLQAFEAEPLALYALYPHSRHLAAKLRRLVDFLAERFKGKPAWDEGW